MVLRSNRKLCRIWRKMGLLGKDRGLSWAQYKEQQALFPVALEAQGRYSQVSAEGSACLVKKALSLGLQEPSCLSPPGSFWLTQAVLPQEGFPFPSVGSLCFGNNRGIFFFYQIWPQANLPSSCRWYIPMKIVLSSGLYVYIMWNLEIDSNRIKRQSSLFCLNSEEKVREQLNVEKRKKKKDCGNEEINWEQENDGKWKERIADFLHTHTSSPDSQ